MSLLTKILMVANISNGNPADIGIGKEFTISLPKDVTVTEPTIDNIGGIRLEMKTENETILVSPFRVAALPIIREEDTANITFDGKAFRRGNETAANSQELRGLGIIPLGRFLKSLEKDANGNPPDVSQFKFKVIGKVPMTNVYANSENPDENLLYTLPSYSGFTEFQQETRPNGVPLDLTNPADRDKWLKARNACLATKLKSGVAGKDVYKVYTPVVQIVK